MISIKQINERDIDLCYELDLNTISLWSKQQWANEFKKEGTKIFGLLFENFVIGICVFNVVLGPRRAWTMILSPGATFCVITLFCLQQLHSMSQDEHRTLCRARSWWRHECVWVHFELITAKRQVFM